VLRASFIWLAALAGVIFLYRSGAGGADAPAMAEAREHKVSLTEPGTVQSIEVQPGQHVHQGEVLVRLSTAELDAQIAVLKADLARTRSSVDAGATSFASSAFNDERALSAEVQAARQADIELRASAARDRAELVQTERELRQENDLVQRGLVRNDRAQALAARLAPLREQVRTSADRLAAARVRVEQATSRQEAWRHQFGQAADGRATQAQVQPLRDAVETRTAELQALEERRGRMSISAPVDGHVTAINARPGDVVRVGDPAVTVTAAVSSQVVAYLAEHHRVDPVVGQRVLVRLATGEGADLEGRIRGVSEVVTQTPSRFWASPQVAQWGREVYIDMVDGRTLKPGQQLQVRFMGGLATP
jgi:multidrug resistance efflux pump